MGTLKYMRRFVHQNGLYQNFGLSAVAGGSTQLIELSIMATITAISIAAYDRRTIADGAAYTHFWRSLRDTLKGTQYAIKSWLCLSPALQAIPSLWLASWLPFAGLIFVPLSAPCE